MTKKTKRTIAVLKARGSAHDLNVHELEITGAGAQANRAHGQANCPLRVRGILLLASCQFKPEPLDSVYDLNSAIGLLTIVPVHRPHQLR